MTGHATEMADRVAIHNLLMEYGAALDRHDFDAFGKLFGADGRYDTLEDAAVGPEAGTMMREHYETGTNLICVPNFHFFSMSLSGSKPRIGRAPPLHACS
jgi:hypothetical protein